MSQIRHLTRSSIIQNFHRGYVSFVSVNVNSFNSLRIKCKDFMDSSEEVTLKFVDDKNKEVDSSEVSSLKIVTDGDGFKMDCPEPNNLSATLFLPVVSSPETEIKLKVQKTNVQVEKIQAKSLSVDVKSGNISLESIQGDSVTLETQQGNISTKGMLQARTIRLISKNGVSAQNKLYVVIFLCDEFAFLGGACYETTKRKVRNRISITEGQKLLQQGQQHYHNKRSNPEEPPWAIFDQIEWKDVQDGRIFRNVKCTVRYRNSRSTTLNPEGYQRSFLDKSKC